MREKRTKIIVTLGPSTRTERDLRMLKDRGVDFVRCNMSHSSLDELQRSLSLARRVDIPFIIDTQGAQIRTGPLDGDSFLIEEHEELHLCLDNQPSKPQTFSLSPPSIVSELGEGDLLSLGFGGFVLRVSDTSTLPQGFVTVRAVNAGLLEGNKAVVVDTVLGREFSLPPLTSKDHDAITIGLKENIQYIAASFVRSASSVNVIREISSGKMKIISKIECVDALCDLDNIIDVSDYLLIDRGDLGKEVPIEKIPILQKTIIDRANRKDTKVFVATNLLESMITDLEPHRSEAQDVVSTIIDGAYGLTLAAETAIGARPIQCVNMLNRLIVEAESMISINTVEQDIPTYDIVQYVEKNALAAEPHGGTLVNRVMSEPPSQEKLQALPTIRLTQRQQMDVEQIANGTLSPLQGPMGQEDFSSVLDSMRLASGSVWPLPIVLDVSKKDASALSLGDDVALTDGKGLTVALLHLEEIYSFDKRAMAKAVYSTEDLKHPGVQLIEAMEPCLLGGPISLIHSISSTDRRYALTPKQTRGLFEKLGWSKIIGFHTRNVIHRAHEYIQMRALEESNCDGLLIHPVVGKKRAGDFHARPIIKSYEMMLRHFYPRDKVTFGVFPTFARYAGPREALFTALCRKNFGCSHFVVGRDHTGVEDFYSPTASQEIFHEFPDLGITPIFFNRVFYSCKQERYVSDDDDDASHHDEGDKLHISGTGAREALMNGESLPSWYMRPEISSMLSDMLATGEHVFVQDALPSNP